jgi:type I restriction enzyme M protein
MNLVLFVQHNNIKELMLFMASGNGDVEKRLWATADELRANSGLKASEYSTPVLGLIFLRYADYKFTLAEQLLKGKSGSRHDVTKEDYQAKSIL